MFNIIQAPDNFYTDENTYWLIFNPSDLNIIVAPNICPGFTISPFTMVTADTIEQLNSYITNNNLVLGDNLSLL
jgi:hypothetical protein